MPKKSVASFTLLEMVITLGIFLLLTAAVFGIITSVLSSSATLRDSQNRRDQVAALNAYLQKSFGNLPGSGVLMTYTRGDGEGLTNNGVIVGHDTELTAIDAKVQPNGYYLLRVAHAQFTPQDLVAAGSPLFAFQTSLQNDDQSIAWTPLMHDVSLIYWRFQSYAATEWEGQWIQARHRPALVELTMQPVGDLQPNTMEFWLPNVTAPPATFNLPGGPLPGPPPTAPPTTLPPSAPPTTLPPSLPPGLSK